MTSFQSVSHSSTFKQNNTNKFLDGSFNNTNTNFDGKALFAINDAIKFANNIPVQPSTKLLNNCINVNGILPKCNDTRMLIRPM